MQTVRFDLPAIATEIGATAVTMNFIVYLGDHQHYEQTMSVAETVAGRLPARLVVVDTTHGAPKGSAVAPFGVSADGRRVYLAAAGRNESDTGRVAAGAVIRNVPTMIWWASALPCAGSVVAELLDCASGLVIDSSLRGEHSIETVSRMQAQFRRLSLRDLAWNRIGIWRDAIASTFDDATAAATLPAISRLDIYGSSASEASYLLGWLASRLGWTINGSDVITRSDRAVDFRFHEEAGSRGIRAVRVAHESASFELVMAENGEAVTCRTRLAAMSEVLHYVPCVTSSEASLLEHALMQAGTDELFEAALRTLRDARDLDLSHGRR